MVKKLYPLCENHLFSKAYRKGKSNAGRFVAVYVLKSYGKKDETGGSRLGITVNKKLGKAVKRSRVKRIIRAAYRMLMPDILPGYIIIAAARGAAFAKGVKSTDVARQLRKSLESLGVIEKNAKGNGR